jgi:phospholipid/cholesterol/gamma-HCH transport system permease protein
VATAPDVVVQLPEPLEADAAPAVTRRLAGVGAGEASVVVDLGQVRRVDSFGLAALADGVRRLRAAGRTVRVVGVDPTVRRRAALLRLDQVLATPPPVRAAPGGPLERLGAAVGAGLDDTVVLLAMLYDGLRHSVVDGASTALGREQLTRQVAEVGAGAGPIVAGVSFLLGAIMALQTGHVLEPYGATAYVARGVGLSMTREIGPLMAAVLVAGRTGSAIAAEVGTMVVYEEVDALEMMALRPRRFLLSPRFLALCLAVPILSLIAGVAGIVGGAVTTWASYGVGWGTYYDLTVGALYATDILSGVIKSIFFGGLIATIACQRGLALRGGPEAVGRAATTAVVRGIVAVVLFDAAFTAATRSVL